MSYPQCSHHLINEQQIFIQIFQFCVISFNIRVNETIILYSMFTIFLVSELLVFNY